MLIEPDGFAVLTVPIGACIETDEFYPDLKSWTEEGDGTVTWVDSDGLKHIDSAPEYHGGGGRTLAFRRWSEQDLIERLLRIGFTSAYRPKGNTAFGVPEISDPGILVALK
jgi:hypothetical protein